MPLYIIVFLTVAATPYLGSLRCLISDTPIKLIFNFVMKQEVELFVGINSSLSWTKIGHESFTSCSFYISIYIVTDDKLELVVID